MNCILLQKQEPSFIFTKSINQNPNIKAQTSDEIQILQNYGGGGTIVFDDTLLSKQTSKIDLLFVEVDNNLLIFTIYLKPVLTHREN